MKKTGASEDLGFDPSTLSGKEVVAYLDSRVSDVLSEVESSHLWKLVTASDGDPNLVREFLKEVYLEIFLYNASVVESTIAVIGQMPRSLSPTVVGEMLHHQVEEFDHGEMGLRDYIALGGDEAYARNRRISPSAFAISGMWEMLRTSRDPFAYLGAEYLFEALTPILAEKIKGHLTAKGMQGSMEFVEFHATADWEHIREMKELILQVCEGHPERNESICYGFEYFNAVYPMPAWQAAYRRAVKRMGSAVPA